MGTIGAGAGKVRRRVAAAGVVCGAFGLWMVPGASAPPTFGWWCEYHSFSAQTTMDAPPCSRNHSASAGPRRAPEGGVGQRTAEETASQIRKIARMRPR